MDRALFTKLPDARRLFTYAIRLRPRVAIRLQHDHPHKEYFQDPVNPSNLDFHPPERIYHPPQSPHPPTRISRPILRIVRSSIWIGVCSFAGLISGGLLASWVYINEPFPPGSEDDTELLDEIEESFETHPTLMNLRSDPDWVEVVGMPSVDKNLKKNIMFQSLNGSRGIQTKVFFNAKRKMVNTFVCFGGGVEGWPDVIHGGAYFIVFREALYHLISGLYPNRPTTVMRMEANYKQKMRPHVVYTLVATPKNMLVDMSDGTSLLKGNPGNEEALEVMCLLVDDDALHAATTQQAEKKGVFVEGLGVMGFPETQALTEGGSTS